MFPDFMKMLGGVGGAAGGAGGGMGGIGALTSALGGGGMGFMGMMNGGGGAGGVPSDGGWGAGTTVNPQGAFFARDLDGGVSGLTPDAKKGMGQVGASMKAAGKEMQTQPQAGAFAPPPNPNQDPNIANAQAFYQAIQQRRMQGR